MTTARAFWTVAPGRGELRTETLPAPGPGQLLVRALHSGVSRGTESLVWRGRVPSSLHRTMRAPFQDGEFPFPVKYGYSSVGVVEDGPPAWRGRTVFCLFPHQSAYLVPVTAVTPLPEDLPPARAVLAANMETALNGLWDAGPLIGDRVAIVGAGTVGLLCAWLTSRVPGCRVQLIDPLCGAAKAAAASRLGVPLNTPEATAAATERADADLVIHASGAPDGLVTALALAGFEATVLELSWFGDRPVTLPLGEAFHQKRLRLRSSQVGSVAGAQRARWDPARRLATALQLLREPALDALLNSRCRFADLPRWMARLAADAGDVLCHRVDYVVGGADAAGSGPAQPSSNAALDSR